MVEINWFEEVEKRRDNLIEQTKQLLRIKSILNEADANDDAPFGKEVKEALMFMLSLGEQDGFVTKNVNNVAGHLQFGSGEDLLGILCHVDVVPAGDGWKSEPFNPEIRENKIYARGAIDDKGPTMAAYFAMKIVKELNLPLNKRVRMIIGTDEESDWRCVDNYFENEEMPDIGFAPDADFPIINAEKGIADFDIIKKFLETPVTKNECIIVESFSAGERSNMVPDLATCTLTVNNNVTKIIQQFETFSKKHQLEKEYFIHSGQLVLQIKGIAAHGMEPKKGVNAGLFLAQFLTEVEVDQRADDFFKFVTTYFQKDSRGRNLGIAYSDDITGDLTVNVGVLTYKRYDQALLSISLRYPVTTKISEKMAKLQQVVTKNGLAMINYSNSKPHYVDKDSNLIKTLQKVYEEQTGDEARLLAIGGGTYARSLTSGVAFGPLFPGREDVAHQKDEHIYIDDLLKATAIYAQAIYELAK